MHARLNVRSMDCASTHDLPAPVGADSTHDTALSSATGAHACCTAFQPLGGRQLCTCGAKLISVLLCRFLLRAHF